MNVQLGILALNPSLFALIKIKKMLSHCGKAFKNPITSILQSCLVHMLTCQCQMPRFSFCSEKQVLSSDALRLCSPLMRRILSNAPIKELTTEAAELIQKEREEASANSETILEGRKEDSEHDLDNFRHMLAGPLLSEANLDKFCEKKKQSPLLLDVKYDGERTLIRYKKGEQLQMISRNGKTQQTFYSDLHQKISQQLDTLPLNSISLDGEIVAIDRTTQTPLPFGDLLKQKRIKGGQGANQGGELGNAQLLVYIFDVVEKDGESLLKTPLIERRKLIPSAECFRTAQHQVVHFPEERAKIFEFFRDVLERHYEGLIIKGTNDLYYTNESRTHWKKLKRGFANTRDARISKIQLDLVVMGANRGQGSKNSKTFTSYLLGTPYKGKILPISNVGSGLTEHMIALITQHVADKNLSLTQPPPEYELGAVRADVYFKPELVFEVNAQELTVSPLYKLGAGEFGGLSLRFPVFRGIRNDKGVSQATSGQQILELSRSYNFNLPS